MQESGNIVWSEVMATFRRDGVNHDADVADVLGISRQALKKWSSKPSDVPPMHVELCLSGYVAWRRTFGGLPCLPTPTVGWFQDWAEANGLRTLDDVGEALGRSRTTVCGWLSNARFPSWIALACLGYGATRAVRGGVDRLPGPPDTAPRESEPIAEPIGEQS